MIQFEGRTRLYISLMLVLIQVPLARAKNMKPHRSIKKKENKSEVPAKEQLTDGFTVAMRHNQMSISRTEIAKCQRYKGDSGQAVF